MGQDPIDLRNINPQWTERMKSNFQDKIVYDDDWDFITELEQKKESIYQKAKTTLANKNLLVNENRKNTTINRKEIETRGMEERHQIRIKN